jgi:quinoprotein dehydrogenase-associated probable ABC transporter substrate-binding protein
MRVLNRTITTALTLLLVNSATAFAEEQFRVCADPLNPPYSTKKGNGFENEIAELFAKKLGQHVTYTWFPQRIGFIRNTLKAKLPDSDQYKCNVIMGVPAGYDLTLTTKPYYHSTYIMLIAKGRGWDDIKTSEQLASVDDSRLEQIRIAMFDRGPGTTWLHQNGLIDQGIPYQSMTGDDKNNVAMMIDKDLKAGKIDIAILWGPMAAYVLSNAPQDSYISIPIQSGPGMKFDFSIAMGVRYGDNTRKEQLNKLIDENSKEINAILARFKIPLLPIPKQIPRDDDD